MPTIGSARVQSQTGAISFTSGASTSPALTSFTLQTAPTGTNLFESFSSTNGAVTLNLRTLVANDGIFLKVVSGVIYLSLDPVALQVANESPNFGGIPTAPT